MTDIAELGLAIRSDGVVVAKDRLRALNDEAGRSEARAQSLKRIWAASLATIVAGVAAFGIGITGAVRRMEEMNRMSRQVDQALKNSGNSARTSAREIKAWADQLEDRTGRAAEDVMAVSANLASFGFGRAEFFRSLKLANDMAAAWGGDLKQNLEGLARALDDPLNGMAMLSKRGIKLTEEQKAMAAAFLDAGDKIAAQGVVFDALEAQVKGVAEAGFGGLTAAISRGRKAWDDAFEDLVRGTGKTGDLRDTLIDLAETVSSPEFINAVMGFGSILIQGMNAVAQAVVWAWGKMKEFLAWLDGQQPKNMSSDDLAGRIGRHRAAIEAAEKQLAGAGTSILGTVGHDAGGWFGTKIGAADGIATMRRELATLEEELRNRQSGMDPIGKGAGSFHDMLMQFRTPGSMAGETPFNPYEGMDFTTDKTAKAAEKAKKAYDELTLSARQFIEQQGVEAQALGLTEEAANRLRYEQELLARAANDNINLTPKQAEELRALAQEMATAEEATRRLTEIYDMGKQLTNSFFSDLKRGLQDGQSAWEALGNAAANVLDSIANKALEMAANGIWDMIFGAVMGGLTGGGGLTPRPVTNIGFGSYGSFDTGGWTGGSAGQPAGVVHGQEFVVKAGPAARFRPMLEAMNNNQPMAANSNGGVTVNAPITINGNADGMTLRQMDIWARNTLPGLVRKAVNDPHAVGD